MSGPGDAKWCAARGRREEGLTWPRPTKASVERWVRTAARSLGGLGRHARASVTSVIGVLIRLVGVRDVGTGVLYIRHAVTITVRRRRHAIARVAAAAACSALRSVGQLSEAPRPSPPVSLGRRCHRLDRLSSASSRDDQIAKAAVRRPRLDWATVGDMCSNSADFRPFHSGPAEGNAAPNRGKINSVALPRRSRH